jgi:MSHA pilin protein MshC
MQAVVFGDQVVSGLRRAQKIATGHRRVVCATVGTQAVILRLTDCGSAGVAIDGVNDDDFATTDSALSAKPTVANLYFQPDGRITKDAAGTAAVAAGTDSAASIAIAGKSDGQTTTVRTINVEGTTGYVE